MSSIKGPKPPPLTPRTGIFAGPDRALSVGPTKAAGASARPPAQAVNFAADRARPAAHQSPPRGKR
jgi:hypothetical protein